MQDNGSYLLSGDGCGGDTFWGGIDPEGPTVACAIVAGDILPMPFLFF